MGNEIEKRHSSTEIARRVETRSALVRSVREIKSEVKAEIAGLMFEYKGIRPEEVQAMLEEVKLRAREGKLF